MNPVLVARAEPRVLLMVRGLGAGADRPELLALLGVERCEALGRILIRRLAAWAATVAPGNVHAACGPAAEAPDLRALIGEDATLLELSAEQTSVALAQSSARLFAAGDGPVLVAWPDLPRWRAAHAAGALEDLAAGCDVSFGPAFDGGFYLIALGRPAPSLFSLPEDTWRSPDAMGVAIEAARAGELSVGLLRAERGLHRPEDVRAVLADPLVDRELAAILRAA